MLKIKGRPRLGAATAAGDHRDRIAAPVANLANGVRLRAPAAAHGSSERLAPR